MENPVLKSKSDYAVGVFWSFASAFLWSTTFVSGRFLISNNQIDPVSLSFVRFIIGGAILMLYGYVFVRKQLFAVKWKDILQMAVLALFGVTGMSALLFLGQHSTSAINSSLIMQINPVIIFFLGVFIGERISVLQITGILISLFGCLFVVDVITVKGFAYEVNHLSGDLLVFASACCWAIYSVFGKSVVKRVGGYAATTWTMMLGAFELFILLLILPTTHLLPVTLSAWSIVFYLAVFPTAVAFFAWFEAMDKIELSLLNVMQYLTPVSTIFLAWFFLGERITLFNTLGILLVIGGVMLTGYRKKGDAGKAGAAE